MAFYNDFTSARTTEPDPGSLLAQLQSLDASALVAHVLGTQVYRVKKDTAWLPGHITTAQNTIDTAPATTPQLLAQSEIDHWPISVKALVLALIDQLNTIRAALPTPLPAITPAQALAAVRAKAGTL
jgi:hypothetical protein